MRKTSFLFYFLGCIFTWFTTVKIKHYPIYNQQHCMKKTITLPSSLDSLHEIEQLANSLYAEHQLSGKAYGNILVSLFEAVTNAITHGNKIDTSKKIELSYTVDNSQITFEVRDEGIGFDLSQIPDPTLPENREKLGGRGIQIMSALTEAVAFSTDKGTSVKLQFKRI